MLGGRQLAKMSGTANTTLGLQIAVKRLPAIFTLSMMAILHTSYQVVKLINTKVNDQMGISQL